jgi:hypothetical protein
VVHSGYKIPVLDAGSSPSFVMAQQEQPEDYNAFGYDPRGRVANMAGLMFGEDWFPDQQSIPHHHGPNVAPPQFGPPANYQ